jgi:tRNA nucleotidyltransferase (CCA-adding enzyme)
MTVYEKAIDIVCILQKKGYEAYFVGGCVRDMLRNVTPKDYDIVTSAKPEEIKSTLKNMSNTSLIEVGEQFGIVILHDIELNENFEIATFRADGNYDGRKPESISYVSTIEEDLCRRDFRINSIALDPITKNLIDPLHGADDIISNKIVFVGNAYTRINEDRLRILRAYRFCAEKKFVLSSSALAAIKHFINNNDDLTGLSQERITQEFSKILTSDDCDKTLAMMAEHGILQHIIPEIIPTITCEHMNPWHKETYPGFGNTVFAHILHTVKNTPNELEVRLAALLHDIAKPQVETFIERNGIKRKRFLLHEIESAKMAREILIRMKYPTYYVNSITEVIHDHMKAHELGKTKKASVIRRLCGKNTINLLEKLVTADEKATIHDGMDNEIKFSDILAKARNEYDPMLPAEIITGVDLINNGCTPSASFKFALNKTYDQQLNGCTDKNRLLKSALGFYKQHNGEKNGTINDKT